MRRDFPPAGVSVSVCIVIVAVVAPTLWTGVNQDVSGQTRKEEKKAPDKFAGEKPGEEWDGNALKMNFCWCPSGKFTMGSPKGEQRRSTDEVQAEAVLSRGFWLGKYEVTQAEWKHVVDSEPWRGDPLIRQAGNYPAANISWLDADDFCDEMTRSQRKAGRLPAGWEYRLPTEAQWEYACRAGSKTKFCFGDDDMQLGDFAWYDENADGVGEKYPHRVGLKKPNAWGLHDMHGNVLEWCRDWYAKELPGGKDPEVTRRDRERVTRGGCWTVSWSICRSACRRANRPDHRSFLVGFRVALVQTSE